MSAIQEWQPMLETFGDTAHISEVSLLLMVL